MEQGNETVEDGNQRCAVENTPSGYFLVSPEIQLMVGRSTFE
jgi:hypothetical protein